MGQIRKEFSCPARAKIITEAMRTTDISKPRILRAGLGKDEKEARRILKANHPTQLPVRGAA
jgi:hypothetical protein